VSMPPAIYRSHSGTWYGIAGSVWIEVPVGTTLVELEDYMVFKRPEIPKDTGEKTWQVKGSKGNTYDVKLSSGNYTCTCVGFSWRRKCKHIESIKNG